MLNSCATEEQYLYLPGDYKSWQNVRGHGAPEYANGRVFKPHFYYQEDPQKNRTISIEYNYLYKYDLNSYINEPKFFWKRKCKDTMWKILKKGKMFVVFEWYAQNCKTVESRHQIVKLIEGFDGMHAVSYSEKRNMNLYTRKRWLNIISSAYLATEMKLYNGLNR